MFILKFYLISFIKLVFNCYRKYSCEFIIILDRVYIKIGI